MGNIKASKLSLCLLNRAIKKAKKVPCRYKITAIGFDSNFNPIGMSSNSFRDIGGFCKDNDNTVHKFRGRHAEENLIRRYGKNLKYIFIVRTNRRGNILPIVPCEICAALAEKYGIQIISIPENIERVI